jgi:hypothetical protein
MACNWRISSYDTVIDAKKPPDIGAAPQIKVSFKTPQMPTPSKIIPGKIQASKITIPEDPKISDPSFYYSYVSISSPKRISIPTYQEPTRPDPNIDPIMPFSPPDDATWEYPDIEISSLELKLPKITMSDTIITEDINIPTRNIQINFDTPPAYTPIEGALYNLSSLMININLGNLLPGVRESLNLQVDIFIDRLFNLVNGIAQKLSVTPDAFDFKDILNMDIGKILSLKPDLGRLETASFTTNKFSRRHQRGMNTFESLDSYLENEIIRITQSVRNQFDFNSRYLKDIISEWFLDQGISADSILSKKDTIKAILKDVIRSKLDIDESVLNQVISLYTTKAIILYTIKSFKEKELDIRRWQERIEYNIETMNKYIQALYQQSSKLMESVRLDIEAYNLKIQQLSEYIKAMNEKIFNNNNLKMSLKKLYAQDVQLASRYVESVNRLNKELFNLCEAYFGMYQDLIKLKALSSQALRAEAQWAKEVARLEIAISQKDLAAAEREVLEEKINLLTTIYDNLRNEQDIIRSQYSIKKNIYSSRLKAVSEAFNLLKDLVSLFPNKVDAVNTELSARALAEYLQDFKHGVNIYTSLYAQIERVLSEAGVVNDQLRAERDLAQAKVDAAWNEYYVAKARENAARDEAYTSDDISSIMAEAQITNTIISVTR